MTGIPFEAAAAYAEWRGKRLPSEFEWEYAARGPEARMFGGNTDTFDSARINVADRWEDEHPRAMAVNDPRMAGDLSAFGVVGMGGNVSEWCTSNEIRSFNVRDPETGLVVGGERMYVPLNAYRGPSYRSEGDIECVLCFQGYMHPLPRTTNQRLRVTLGLRCAKSVSNRRAL